MAKLRMALEDAGVRRKRTRIESLKIDRAEIAQRIHKFHQDDTAMRSHDTEARLQRYAKLRMWSQGKDWPWEDASDVALPDIMTNSLRIQDTLHNAVMSTRPAVTAKALSGKQDQEKQDLIDNLIDYQIFVEQEGEKFIGDCADAYVNDGVYTVFVAWVREDREVIDLRFHDPIPDEMVPVAYFKQIIMGEFPKGEIRRLGDGWDWEVHVEEDEEPIKASFYTRDDDRVELVMRRTVRIFDGPRVRVMDYEDVLYPHRAENLQIPGPANPRGASHVLIVDYPTVDEIRRHYDSKFYDLMKKSDMDAIEAASLDQTVQQEAKRQKDMMQGTTDYRQEDIPSHKPLTRILCFDMYDIDNDGIDEDVVFWMILETKTLVKAKHLTEMWPANPPRRPLAGAPFIPVRGRYTGIGIPELMETSHDVLTTIFNQTIDAGTLANAPFGFYRAMSNMKPEVIRAWPGEMYPLSDPQRDVYFPTFSQTAQSFGINMMTVVGQQQERLTMVNELSLGRIPAGQASALRTASGQQNLIAQGEARPERILRRFFIGLTEVWAQIHELNQRFLPQKKKFMVLGMKRPEDDPYIELKSTREIEGRFQFDFEANVLNTSKQILQQSMMQILQIYMNPVAVQLGIVQPENIYNMLRDFGRSLGQDPDFKYLTPPSPDAMEPPILVEEAIHAILLTEPPKGRPAEGAQVHLQKLIEFMQSDNFGFLQTPQQIQLFQSYLLKVRERAMMEMQQQQLMQAMAQFQQSMGGGGGAPGAMAPQTGNPPVQDNEMIDESLPSARGAA